MIRRRLKIVVVTVGVGLLALGVALFIALWDVPGVAIAKTHYPWLRYMGSTQPPLVAWKRARPPAWVDLNEVSKTTIGAVIVNEDFDFYRHPGFDRHQIREAIKEDFREMRFARGASTITQQVARNLFLDQDRTLWRKLKEVVLAVSLERKLPKKRILELYLNIAEWGIGLYGIGPASQRYFNKIPSALTPKEAAFLAMLLPSPVRYSSSFYRGKLTPYAEERVQKTFERMVSAGYLTKEEADRAAHLPLSFEQTVEPAQSAGGEAEVSE